MSDPILFTLDAQWNSIELNAKIKAHSPSDALAVMRACHRDSGMRVTGMEPGSFGDCWVKFREPPELDDNGETIFEGIRCHIAGPGEHPGGQEWWATPCDAVFVPTLERGTESSPDGPDETSEPKQPASETGLAGRLKSIRMVLAKTQPEMERALKLGKSSWQNYEGRGQTPGSKVITRLVRMGFDANWILTGQGSMRISPSRHPGETVPAEDLLPRKLPASFHGLPERLQSIRAALAKTQPEMDKVLGIGKRSWQRYESEGQAPGSKVIARLVHLGFNSNWILTGKGSMRDGRSPLPHASPEGIFHVPMPQGVRSMAHVGLSGDWLAEQELQGDKLVSITMPDDSMHPTIARGGVLIADTARKVVDQFGIWAIESCGRTVIVRIQLQPNRKLLLHHDNHTYQQTVIEADQVTVIGKVIWIATPVS